MRKAGGIVSLVAGIFGTIAAIVTLFVGGVGSAFDAQDADVVVWLGWGGVFFSFLVIVLGAVQIGAKGKTPSTLLIISSIAGMILGGTLVAIFLLLSLIGGILGLCEKTKKSITIQEPVINYGVNSTENNKSDLGFTTWMKSNQKLSVGFLAVVLLIFLISIFSSDKNSKPSEEFHKRSVSGPLVEYQPSEQQGFIKIIESARSDLDKAQNDMVKGGIRLKRKEEICKFLNSKKIENWVGTIKTLDSNSEGKGVLAVSIADDITLETWNNALSDIGSRTLIDTKSEFFSIVSNMGVGQRVVFSGTFYPSDKDCIEEQSLTINGSLSEPGFTLKFSSISSLDDYVNSASSQLSSQKGKLTLEENQQEIENDDGGGPDFWAVTGVSKNDTLNIRSMPNSESTQIGEIPYNGVNIQNLGCNDVPLSRWLQMNEREQGEASSNRWCKIEYQGISGWVHGKFLKEDTVSQENGDVSGEQNVSTITITSIPSKAGFLTRETTARSDIKSESSVSVGIKNGAEIVITGVSNDNVWYEIEAKPLQGKFYVPVENVGTFGN